MLLTNKGDCCFVSKKSYSCGYCHSPSQAKTPAKPNQAWACSGNASKPTNPNQPRQTLNSIYLSHFLSD